MSNNQTLRVKSVAIPQIAGVAALEPVRLSGSEGVNGLFEYELLLKTTEGLGGDAAEFDLNGFLGREICCEIELDGSGTFAPGAVGSALGHLGAGVRQVNAVIWAADYWGEEGRHRQYKLALGPWLHMARLSTDCKIFQDKTVVQILDDVLADYPYRVDKRLIGQYPMRDFQVQYNESDFAFVERLCQEWGINYFFEHSKQAHRLVLCDHMGAFQPNPSEAYRRVPYYPPGQKIDTEYLHSWAPKHRVTSGAYRSTDYDYTQPQADLTQQRADPRPTLHADGEIYQWHASEGGSHWAQPRAGGDEGTSAQDGRQLAALRMQQLRTAGVRVQAKGNLRAMVPGCTFELTGHPRQSANAEYLIVQTQFLIENARESSQPAGNRNLRQWRVEVQLQAHPVKEPLRPAHTRRKPHTHGPQYALVVGPAGKNIWTDEYGRIKVQFRWDRLGEYDEKSSCWIRVASPWAGNQLGAMHVPRIGQEVIVDFIGGDLDLPICTGRVFNKSNMPPWLMPGQSALSGFRSRELVEGGGNSAGGRSNHWLMDDTPGEIQVQFKSDHAHSGVNAGFIAGIDDNSGRKMPRGEGLEARTDKHVAVRGGAGMLLSTDGRPKAEGHITSLTEADRRLKAAAELHHTLGDLAMLADAQTAHDQPQVSDKLDRHNETVGGTGAASPETGKFPELSEPHVVISSPAGVHVSAQDGVHLASEEHVAVTSGAHASMAAGKSVLVSARDAIKLFTAKLGLSLVAAKGAIVIRAVKNAIHLLAHLEITMTADRILIAAKKELQLQGGTSYGLWKSGLIEFGTLGQWVCYAANHIKPGPRGIGMAVQEWPTARFNEQLVLRDPQGRPIEGMRWRLQREDGSVAEGVTDAQGAITLERGTEPTSVDIEFLGKAE